MTEKLRNCKNVSFDLKPGYAHMLSQGLDGLAECFNVTIPDSLLARLDEAKERAKANQADGDGLADITLGEMPLQIAAHGARGGAAYLLSWPDHFSIRINAGRAWGVVVEYEPAALWQLGAEEIRWMVDGMIRTEFKPVPEKDDQGNDLPLRPEHYARLAKAHYCFDFWSACFSDEMKPEIWSRIIQHSSSKKRADGKGGEHQEMIGRADYIETLTMGSKTGLQVQVYDKGKHITEKTGNMWFIDVWTANGVPRDFLAPLKDIWRLELRFSGDYLKDRNVNTFEEFKTCMPLLFTEALRTKRLATSGSRDMNVRRRPMHPLWSLAYKASSANGQMLPIGRRKTRSAEEYREIIRKNIAGNARLAAVLDSRGGRITEDEMIGFVVVAAGDAVSDPRHIEKTEHKRQVYRRQLQARAS